jgi:hypothetical protein
MDIIELPLVAEFMSPVASLKMMQESHVAACIVESASHHYLIRQDRILESLHEWVSPPTEIGRLIIPDELTDGLPTLVGDVTALSQFTPDGRRVGEIQLDKDHRRYGIVMVARPKVVIMTRSERLSGYLRNAPDLYKCKQNAQHIYSQDKLAPGFLCPNIVHIVNPPKPAMDRL